MKEFELFGCLETSNRQCDLLQSVVSSASVIALHS